VFEIYLDIYHLYIDIFNYLRFSVEKFTIFTCAFSRKLTRTTFT